MSSTFIIAPNLPVCTSATFFLKYEINNYIVSSPISGGAAFKKLGLDPFLILHKK